MGDQLMAQARALLEGSIDFEGQRKVEHLSTWILIATGALAFFVGFVQENIWYTLWAGLLGTGIVFLIVIPPWPAFNEDPEPWLPSKNSISSTSIVVDGKKVN